MQVDVAKLRELLAKAEPTVDADDDTDAVCTFLPMPIDGFLETMNRLLAVYEAWQGAAETTMIEGEVAETGEPCAETIDCFSVELIGQRVKLVPAAEEEGHAG